MTNPPVVPLCRHLSVWLHACLTVLLLLLVSWWLWCWCFFSLLLYALGCGHPTTLRQPTQLGPCKKTTDTEELSLYPPSGAERVVGGDGVLFVDGCCLLGGEGDREGAGGGEARGRGGA